MGVVYRDKRGVEYESVPLATSEVTDAVPLDAHIVSKRVVRKPLPIYEGTDGEQLARAPRSQRRNWTNEQWGAYEEHRRLVADQSKDNAPVASVVVIRSEREGPTGQAVAGGLPGVPRVAHTGSVRAPFDDTCQRSILAGHNKHRAVDASDVVDGCEPIPEEKLNGEKRIVELAVAAG